MLTKIQLAAEARLYTNRTSFAAGEEGLSYRQMCDFWTHKIFTIDEIKSLQSYLRLDDDSFFNSEIDIFERFKASGKDYGYFSYRYDHESVSIGYNEMVKRYIELHDLGSYLPEKVNLDGRSSPSFYNNFELVRVRHFFREDVQDFTKHVVNNGGIYEYRWGDAITRFFQVLLFTNRIECYHDGFKYSHQKILLNEEECL